MINQSSKKMMTKARNGHSLSHMEDGMVSEMMKSWAGYRRN